jgi:putative zinc finger/helix-turn-helix YgiT family protein
MKCLKCGSQLIPKEVSRYHYTESGLDNVYLTAVQVRRCPKCKTLMPEIPNLLYVQLCIALYVIEKPGRLSGKEVRFLRKNLAMKSKEFADKLGYTAQTFSRIEQGKAVIGPQGDRLVRLWFLAQKSAELSRFRSPVDVLQHFHRVADMAAPDTPINIDTSSVSKICGTENRPPGNVLNVAI